MRPIKELFADLKTGNANYHKTLAAMIELQEFLLQPDAVVEAEDFAALAPELRVAAARGMFALIIEASEKMGR